jgi:hypothetical protein
VRAKRAGMFQVWQHMLGHHGVRVYGPSQHSPTLKDEHSPSVQLVVVRSSRSFGWPQMKVQLQSPRARSFAAHNIIVICVYCRHELLLACVAQ